MAAFPPVLPGYLENYVLTLSKGQFSPGCWAFLQVVHSFRMHHNERTDLVARDKER